MLQTPRRQRRRPRVSDAIGRVHTRLLHSMHKRRRHQRAVRSPHLQRIHRVDAARLHARVIRGVGQTVARNQRPQSRQEAFPERHAGILAQIELPREPVGRLTELPARGWG